MGLIITQLPVYLNTRENPSINSCELIFISAHCAGAKRRGSCDIILLDILKNNFLSN